MSENEHPIAASLDMVDPPRKEITVLPSKTKNISSESNEENDYKFARENIMETVLKSNEALQEILDIAKTMESPRAYEVAANLVKTIIDGNKDLVDMTKKHEKDKRDQNPDESQNQGVVNNNLFVGTAAELSEFIEKQKEKEHENS